MVTKPYHHEKLRESLIEAGIELMNEQGYEQLSLRKIASRCGVSHTAPYRHFANKSELLAAMQSHVEGLFSGILRQSVADGKQLQHPMVEFGKAYVRFFVAHPTYYAFFTRQEGIWVTLSTDVHEINSNYEPFLIFKEQALRHLTAENVPASIHSTMIIQMWATVHGIAGMATLPAVAYRGDWEKLTEQILMGADIHA